MPRFGIRAQDQARDPRSIPELRAVGPFLDQRWLDMVEPAAPVVPGDEDDRVAPQTALDDGIYLVGSPFLAGLDRFDRMFAQPLGPVDPGDRRQFAGRGILRKAVRAHIVFAAFEGRNVTVGIAAVVAPGEASLR